MVQCHCYSVLHVQVCQVELEQGLKSLVLARFWCTQCGQRLPGNPVIHQELDLQVDGALGAVGKVKVQVAEDQVEALLLDHQLLALALSGLTDPLLHQAQLGAVHWAGHWEESKGVLTELHWPPFSPRRLPEVFPAKRRHLLSGFLQEIPEKLLHRQLGAHTWRWSTKNYKDLPSPWETHGRNSWMFISIFSPLGIWR